MVGTGSASFCGEGGPGNATCLNNQRAVVMSSWGDLFFADSANKQVRKVISLSFFSCSDCNSLMRDVCRIFVRIGEDGRRWWTRRLCWRWWSRNFRIALKHSALTIASWGDIFIADSTNNVVRKVPTCLDVSCLYF